MIGRFDIHGAAVSARYERTEMRQAWAPVLSKLAVIAVVFTAFFPNPALPLGSALGLQPGQLIALAMVPWILLRRPFTPSLAAVLAIVGMAVVTGFAGLMTDSTMSADLVVKMIVLLILSTVVMIPAGYYADRAFLKPIALAAAAAILIHALVGLYQMRQFEQGVFPFGGLLNNPSFASAAADPETYTTYIKRPFGLFPEPSAMGASIGPWLTLLAGLILRRDLTGRHAVLVRRLALVALVAGTVLMFIARSGYTALWLATFLPVVIVYLLQRSQPGLKRTFSIFFGTVAGLALVAAAWSYASSAVNPEAIDENSSWSSRQQSIVIALTAPSEDPRHFMIGYGPGQAATYLMKTPTEDLLPSWYSDAQIEQVITVWSVLGLFYMENGLIGLIVLGTIITVAVRAIWRSGARLLGLCVLLGWFAGATIATSYLPLSPVWAMLALMLAWDHLFPAAGRERALALTWTAPLPRH